MSDVLLDVQNLTMRFGGLKAVDQLSFSIHKGQLAGLIGPNGAGKTTVFNMLTGVYAPTHGKILLEKQEIQGKAPYEISHLGVTRTFQNIRLFKQLTVLQNILIACEQHTQSHYLDIILQRPSFFAEEKKLQEKAQELLHIFKIDHRAEEKAGSLPYGEQRKLEIIRALATQPKLILLDEPAAGMNHSETHGLMETIAQIRTQFNLTVLLIEHDMKLVMGICENIIVLDHGVKIEEGSPIAIRGSQKVIEAYLGPEEVH